MLRVTGGLDVEQNPVYYFAVEARDRENPDLHDTAAVSIVIQNINDNTPVFSEVVLSLLPLLLLTLSLLPLLLSLLSLLHCLQDTYSWSIAEDTAAGTLIGVVTAGDEENEALKYSIVNTTYSTLLLTPARCPVSHARLRLPRVL